MTADSASTDLRFEAPGPGTWMLDAVHFPRPATRYWQEMHPEPFKRGYAAFTAFYGLLISHLELAYINGFMYGSMIPVPDAEVPARFQRAEEVFANKLWREQVAEWDQTAKPAAIRTHRELQAIDPESLADDALLDYLARCRDHHGRMITQHMSFTGTATIPTSDLVVHAAEWTGRPPAELLSMMRGAAPVSGGGSGELDRMLATVRDDPSARSLLDSGDDATKVLDKVRALDSDAGRALSAYLDLAGYRLVNGFDISSPYALELPDALLQAIRSAVDSHASAHADVDDLIADVRREVPEQHRSQFDDLLNEARYTYRIRDERGVYSDVWAAGIMRRAAMAAGRRLAGKGHLHDAEHFTHAGLDEMRALLTGSGGPSADELAARYAYQTSHTAKDAPPFLGPPPQAPPDPSGLPPAAARVMRAMGFAGESMFAPSQAPHEEKVLRGLAASGGRYEGPVRLVSGHADFDRIAKGDVLVTESTTEAFNILLPLLGAIVTDSGGLLSHAAIVAREYGIPGVVGTRDATQRITDGAIVRVDGDAGEVTVLG